MKLRHLHIHLVDANDCRHIALTHDFKHTVYSNKDGKTFPFPKVDDIAPEIVDMGCQFLEVEVPDEVLQILNGNKGKQ